MYILPWLSTMKIKHDENFCHKNFQINGSYLMHVKCMGCTSYSQLSLGTLSHMHAIIIMHVHRYMMLSVCCY